MAIRKEYCTKLIKKQSLKNNLQLRKEVTGKEKWDILQHIVINTNNMWYCAKILHSLDGQIVYTERQNQ